MANTRFGSLPSFNGQKVVLDNDARLTTFRAPSTGDLNLKVYATTENTNATGALTVTLPAGYFTTVYGCTPTPIRDTNNPASGTFAMIRTISNTTITIQCFESKNTGVLLGGTIEGLEATPAVIPVNVIVFGI